MLRIGWTLAVGMASPTAQAADWTPTAEESALLLALSSRDAPASCEVLEATVAAPVASLSAIVTHVTMPPWAGMRAADCLIKRHGAEVAADLDRWVTRPELKGLGTLVLSQIDVLPADVALAVARRAVSAGPDPVDARRRLGQSTRPEIRALATP